MCDSRQIKYFPIGLLSDIDEPVISGNSAIFVQNSCNGSKISVYNIKTGKTRTVNMKNIICFNVHADNNNIAFEFSGAKRGIGIIKVETLESTELNDMGNEIILGGIWNNYIIFRRNQDIVLYDFVNREERILASCHHLLGSPVVGHGICAWLQAYRDKCCVIFYDIKKERNLILSSSGYINKMYAIEEYLVYQNCCNNKCSIYSYNIRSGELKKIFESNDWVELYKGKDGVMVWTVRKECQRMYTFDIWICSIYNNSVVKLVSDCKNAVIPTVSNDMMVWVDASMDGDSLNLMPIELKI